MAQKIEKIKRKKKVAQRKSLATIMREQRVTKRDIKRLVVKVQGM